MLVTHAKNLEIFVEVVSLRKFYEFRFFYDLVKNFIVKAVDRNSLTIFLYLKFYWANTNYLENLCLVGG